MDTQAYWSLVWLSCHCLVDDMYKGDFAHLLYQWAIQMATVGQNLVQCNFSVAFFDVLAVYIWKCIDQTYVRKSLESLCCHSIENLPFHHKMECFMDSLAKVSAVYPAYLLSIKFATSCLFINMTPQPCKQFCVCVASWAIFCQHHKQNFYSISVRNISTIGVC